MGRQEAGRYVSAPQICKTFQSIGKATFCQRFNKWLIRPVMTSSDADSDVLADYVLALIRADTPEPELRLNAIENLEDFLKDSTHFLIVLGFYQKY